jgi:hypothetical protein
VSNSPYFVTVPIRMDLLIIDCNHFVTLLTARIKSFAHSHMLVALLTGF